jgi:uncharacterized phage protein (TIGR02220 family)
MSADNGYIACYRSLRKHWLWEKNRPRTKAEAWIDLIMMVNHADGQAEFRGELFDIKRGQRLTSILQLSGRWKWSRTKTKNFLNLLKKDHMVDLKQDTRKCIVTILNYDIYNRPPDNKSATKVQQTGQQECNRSATEVQQKDTNKKKEKNNKKEKNKEYIPPSPPEESLKISEEKIPYAEIVEMLNLALGKDISKRSECYQDTTKQTRKDIKARWKEGYRLKDFEYVIKVKCADWYNDPKQAKYLRPETLFGRKFEGYRNQPLMPNTGCATTDKTIMAGQAFIQRKRKEKEMQDGNNKP